MTRIYRPRPVRRFPVALPEAARSAYHERVLGLARNGSVGIRNFDQGVVETLDAFVAPDPNGQPKYWLKVDPNPWGDRAKGIPELPGVPVFFANPEDVNQDMKLPFVEVRRDDISAAMERWQAGANEQYRAPAPGAQALTATLSDGTVKTSYDRMEMRRQAEPVDITYTISVKARFRGAPGQRNQVNGILAHILGKYRAYSTINVVDSIGDLRWYAAFREGVSNLDNIVEVQERILGFAVTIRVEAELDDPSDAPYTSLTVRLPLTQQLQQR
jgi:hypothetical protein